jgi:predicted metalloprotease
MRWQGRRQSDNVEDVRGQQSGGLGGGFGRGGGGMGGPGFRIVRGGGISGILILVVMFFVLRAFGIDPLPLLFGDGSINSTQTQQSSGRTAAEGGTVANDEATQFARTVLAETEDVWSGIFPVTRADLYATNNGPVLRWRAFSLRYGLFGIWSVLLPR